MDRQTWKQIEEVEATARRDNLRTAAIVAFMAILLILEGVIGVVSHLDYTRQYRISGVQRNAIVKAVNLIEQEQSPSSPLSKARRQELVQVIAEIELCVENHEDRLVASALHAKTLPPLRHGCSDSGLPPGL